MPLEYIEATIFIVRMMTSVGGTVRENVVLVGLLRIGVGTDLQYETKTQLKSVLIMA